MTGANIVYSKASSKTRAGLDKSRAKERAKWMDSSAGVKLWQNLLGEFIQEGHAIAPNQWIEQTRNLTLRAGKEHLHSPE